MNIVGVSADWMEGYGNYPSIILHVDEIPEINPIMADKDGIWYGCDEATGLARYYAWKGPLNEGGFGGAKITINTAEGEKQLLGPWSSRATAVNKVFRLNDPIVDVYLQRTTDVWRKHVAIKLSVLMELSLPFFLVREDTFPEAGPILPSVSPYRIEKPSGMVLVTKDVICFKKASFA